MPRNHSPNDFGAVAWLPGHRAIFYGKGSIMLEFTKKSCKARAMADIQYSLSLLYVEGGVIVTTDGHRMHSATLEHGLEPGLYAFRKATLQKVLLTSAPPNSTFPRWRDIRPLNLTGELCLSSPRLTPRHIAHAYGYALAREGIMINPDFLADAAYLGTVHFGTERDPIRIVSSDIENMVLDAVIMPCTPPAVTTITRTIKVVAA